MSDTEHRGLVAALERHTRAEGLHATPIPALDLFRRTLPTGWAPALYEPALFFLARGAKELQIAGAIHRYDASHYVLASVDLPLICRVSEASEEAPYLALRLRIDPLVVGELMADGVEPPRDHGTARGIGGAPVEPRLLDAVTRLVALLDTPRDVPVLAPLLLREIFYRVLSGPQGARLRQTVASGAPAQGIARAIAWIRDHADEALRVEDVAHEAGMGLSAFHVHFKTVTGMSPLQFQKRLRLLEAKRLLVSAGITAAETAHRVGYASASQFSRDYRRAFGAPPGRDVARIRSDDHSVVL
jgi:AraC-like DNA-binding protein